MVQGGEKKGEREKEQCMWKGWKGGNKKERKIVQGVKRKKRRKNIYCGKVRKVETKKEK